MITSLWTGDLFSWFFPFASLLLGFLLGFPHSYTLAAAVHLIFRACQWQNAQTYQSLLFRLLRRSCKEILTVLPFRCNINQGHLYWGWRIKLSEQYIRYLQRKEKTRHRSLLIPPGLRSHPSACSQFPQSCLRRCRECMRLSSVAHFTRWSDWIRCNSLYFHSHSPLGESKVPERFHAWDRGVAVAHHPHHPHAPPTPLPQTTLANTLPPARLSAAAAPFQWPPLTAWKKGNLPAKQKKLNCGSDDHSEHSTRAQLSSSSKGALRLASNKKIIKEKRKKKKKFTAVEAI